MRKPAGSYAVPPVRRKKAALPKAAPKRKPAAKPVSASRTVATPRPSGPVASAPRSRALGKGRTPAASAAAAAASSKRVPFAPRPLKSVAAPHPSRRGKAPGRIAAVMAPVRSVLARLPLPHVGRGPVLIAAAAVAALAIAAVVVVNSSLFSATDVTVNGSDHVSAEVARKLVKVPDGTTLLNVSEDDILAQLSANPWVSGVDIQRNFPHGLTITPVERTVKAVVYIPADGIAWGVGEDGSWIAPISLATAAGEGDDATRASADAGGKGVDEGDGSSEGDSAQASADDADGAADVGSGDTRSSSGDDGADDAQTSSDADGDTGDQDSSGGDKDADKDADADQASGAEAAQTIAKRDGALLLTDVPSDISPRSGEPVGSETVEAGLEYAKGFSASFLKQIKSLSVPSVEAISATLASGIEVSLGEPEDIAEKERVVTKLLEQEKGVTYINVREPGAYTFRSATS